MKILLVSSSVSNSGHGKAYLNNIFKNMDADVNVFVPNDSEIDVPENRTFKSALNFSKISRENYSKYGKFGLVLRGFNRINYGIKFHKDLLKHTRSNKYDVIHLLDSDYVAYVYLTIKINKVKLFYTIHASDFNLDSFNLASIYKYLIKFFLKRSLKKTNGVFCHGNWIKSRLIKAFPEIKNKTYALDYPSDSYIKYDKDQIKDSLNLPKNKVIISFIGMIRKDKKIEIALEVIKKLGHNYHLLIAGSLADYSKEQMQELLSKANIHNNITANFKYLTYQEYTSHFKAGDIFLSTHSDVFPSASGPVSDARSYGIPVVVPPNGQLSAYAKEHKVGLVANSNTVEGFTDACLELSKNLEQYKDEVLIASKKLSWKSFSNNILNSYEL